MAKLLNYINYYILEYSWGTRLKSNWHHFHSGKQEKLCLWLLGFILGCSTLFHLINSLFFHYTSIWLSGIFLILISAIIIIMIIGCVLENQYKRIGLTLFTLGLLFLLTGFISYGCGAVSSTPFPLIDHSLLHLDKLLHFNSVATMAWVHAHPSIHKALSFSYDMWAIETIAIAIFCAAIGDRHMLMRYINTILIANIIGSLIYYFFPSCGPASLLHSPYFPSEETIVYPAYYAIHNHQILKYVLVPLIAFPSFHVIHSVIFCYVLKKYWQIKKCEWRIPIIAIFIVNMLLIASTFMLGHHYVADIIAGVVIAVLSWEIVKKFESKKSLVPKT